MDKILNKLKRKRKRKIIDYYSLVVWSVMVVVFLVLGLQTINRTIPTGGELSYSEFWSLAEEDKIESVLETPNEDTLIVYTTDGETHSVVNANYD